MEKLAYQLTKGLSSKGCDLFVITRQSQPPSADIERVGNVFVRRIPPKGQLRGKGWKALGPILLFLINILYLLIRNVRRYDIIMIIGIKTLPIPAVLVSMVARKKCIIRIESPKELWEEIAAESLQGMSLSGSSILLKLWRGIRNPLIRRADCFVAISSEIKQELIGIGVEPKKIHPIPNGIDTDKFCPVSKDEKLKIRQKLSLPKNKVILVFTGRLVASKGLLLLIQVWKEIVKKYKDIHLTLVGTGKDSFDSCEDELRDYIKVYELESSVSITGEVENVYEYLQACDVFVFPSEYEGFGLSIVEALACALPTVVTRVGVASELIKNGKNGVLVNPNDQLGIQKAIEWLLDRKDLWEDMGKDARRCVVKEYSIEAMIERHHKIIIELMRQKNQTPNHVRN